MKTVEIKRPSDMTIYKVWWKTSYPFRETDATHTHMNIYKSFYDKFKRGR